MPQLGETATCRHCQRPIQFRGDHWDHINYNALHPAWPVTQPVAQISKSAVSQVSQPAPLSIPDPDESWARVELYRWQTGHLPSQNLAEEPLSIPSALRNMAKAIDVGDRTNLPSRFNLSSVLRYTAALLEKKDSQPPSCS